MRATGLSPEQLSLQVLEYCAQGLDAMEECVQYSDACPAPELCR